MVKSMNSRSSNSDSESYATISSQPPKRRAGRTKFHETRHPIYKGVRRRNNDRWVCEVREPNKKSRIWLGTFPTPEMAARAHDVAALALRGRAACLNFADSPRLLPVAESSCPRDIQRAAAVAAEMFRPRSVGEGAECDGSRVEGGECKNDMLSFLEGNLGRMDSFFDDMAHGMLMNPSQLLAPDYYEVENDVELSLWSFSFSSNCGALGK